LRVARRDRDEKGRFVKGHRPLTIKKVNLSPSPHLAYILGVLKGDGYLHHSRHNKWLIGLNVKDEAFARRFMRALRGIGLNPSIVRHMGKYFRVYAHSKLLYEWIKSLTIKQIEDFLVDNNLEKYFLRGFYDSEGSYSVCKDRKYGLKPFLSMCNTNQQLMELVRRLFNRLGFHNKVTGPFRSGHGCLLHVLKFSWATAERVKILLEGAMLD